MSTLLQKAGLALLIAGSCQLPGAWSQVTGGQHVFQFLSLPVSARVTGLGGAQIAVQDDDPVFAASNPAALNQRMSRRATINHNFFLSDIQHGYVAYVQHLKKQSVTVQGGLQYVQYGDMDRADEFGNVQGKVRASETAFTLGGAKALTDRISLGLNVRMAFSTLDVYQASALLADAGLMYTDTAKRLTMGLVIRNAGAQMATYSDTRESLPLDIQIGITKRLKHLPFRFGVVAHHLTTWDIRYKDPNAQSTDVLLFGDAQPAENKGKAAIDNFFRHLVFNGEFLLGKHEGFRLRVGYNHLRKQELSVGSYRSLAGFSGGIGVKLNRFRVDFGYASYHLAGGVTHLGIGTNLRDW